MRNAIGVLLVCSVTACHLVDVRETKSYEFQSHPISKDVWRAIEVGVTDRQWLLQHIGQPSTVANSADKQIYTYRYEELDKKHRSVFLFYQKQNTDITQRVHAIELKNGVVIAHSDITAVPVSALPAEEASHTDNPSSTVVANSSIEEEAKEESATPPASVIPEALDRDL